MTGKCLTAALAFSLAMTGLWLTQLSPAVLADTDAAGQILPAYHAYALKPPFPATLDPKQFPDAVSRNVYALAAKIKSALFQQPCYCYCDRVIGHKSLLDCFVGTHGSVCDVCEKEAVYVYQQTRLGKTASQIRAAIIRGDWKFVDLRPYTTNLSLQ